MYDYMKALQKRFDRQEHSELDKQVEYAQEELRRDMDAAGRRKSVRSCSICWTHKTHCWLSPR